MKLSNEEESRTVWDMVALSCFKENARETIGKVFKIKISTTSLLVTAVHVDEIEQA